MVTIENQYTIRCHNDCEMGGCPTHKIDIMFQTSGDVLRYDKDGKTKFWMDTTEVNEFLEYMKGLSERTAYIHRPKDLTYEDGYNQGLERGRQIGYKEGWKARRGKAMKKEIKTYEASDYDVSKETLSDK